MRHSQRFALLAIGLVLLAAAGLARTAQAQHTPDPYNIVGEYNLGYEPYMFPAYPNGAGFTPSQGILQGRVSPANQFQNYLDRMMGFGGSSDEALFGATRRGGTFAQPYYRAHRQFDEAFDRVYTPNAGLDEKFRAEQERRTKLYLEYLKEADPKKRAQLFRAYQEVSLKLARDADVGGAGRAGARSRTPAAASSLLPRASAASPSSSLLGPASRANMLRRPSGAASGLNRSRGTSPSASASPLRSETAEDILERATRPPAPSSDLSVPAGPSPAPR
jgi:hypothetical protein